MCSIEIRQQVTNEQNYRTLQMMQLLQNSSLPQRLCLQLSLSVNNQHQILPIASDSLHTGYMKMITRRLKQISCFTNPFIDREIKNQREIIKNRSILRRQALWKCYFNKKECVQKCKSNFLNYCTVEVFIALILSWYFIPIIILVWIKIYKKVYISNIHSYFIWQTKKLVEHFMPIYQKLLKTQKEVGSFSTIDSKISFLTYNRQILLPVLVYLVTILFMTLIFFGVLQFLYQYKGIRCYINRQFKFKSNLNKYGGCFKFVTRQCSINSEQIQQRDQIYILYQRYYREYRYEPWYWYNYY